MIRLLIVCTICSSFFFSCTGNGQKKEEQKDTVQKTSDAVNVLTDEEVKDGWVSLFDGQSLKGWHKYGGAAAGSAWKAEDGVLHLNASQKADWQIREGGDIVTDDEFDNFHLKLDWKIDTCGNSGIILYTKEDTVKYQYMWMTGPEMQVLDNKCHPDAKIIKHRAADLYDLITSSPEVVKPALEWNAVEIKSLNGNLEFYLNGTKVLSTTMWDDNWKKMIAASKFKEWKDFGTYKKGRIGLQDHGNNVWLRNIRIKKL